ncbi:ATG18 [Auxenochlorella protothecoides x Auxenochlorella symbiontica]
MSSLHCAQRGSGVLNVAFNQDNTCVAVADMSGLRVFSLEQHKRAFRLDIGAIGLAQMLFCTSLLAYVGAGEQPTLSPRKLTLYNTHSNAAIQSLSFPSSVLGVHLNRKRLAVVLERRVLLYVLETLELLRTIDTAPNPEGVAALTTCHEPTCQLAVPAGGEPGAVRVYDAASGSGSVLGELRAHRSPLAVLAWNDTGSLLASASQKGTVVRVHAPASPDTVHSFRRGSTPARISGLAFAPSAVQPALLCVASDHGTVHLFRITPQLERKSSTAAAAAVISSVLPATIARAVEPTRCLTTIRLPGRPAASVCSLTTVDGGCVGAGVGVARLGGHPCKAHGRCMDPLPPQPLCTMPFRPLSTASCSAAQGRGLWAC